MNRIPLRYRRSKLRNVLTVTQSVITTAEQNPILVSLLETPQDTNLDQWVDDLLEVFYLDDIVVAFESGEFSIEARKCCKYQDSQEKARIIRLAAVENDMEV